ncbi:hypothetical protein [Tabrizicola sp.]|jgi:hypothetical protein|uniref:hypothetical protein n=1 Tax=Tabrizicola sp. TaxID=2005166 RepID=UPI001A5899C2|nr:hypothetical protein [Tabrizicola sp.]MBL9074473.1 hypothetical protein [Tabrizicola sp.]
MKRVILALPVTILLSAEATAQSDATAIGNATPEAATAGEFGTNWPLSVGTTFFTDADSATLRSREELTKGWQSLSPEDQTMIKADCQAFLTAHGDAGTDGSAAAADTSADTAASDGAATGTTSTDPATTAPTGYDLAEMKAICEAVGTL